MIFIISMIIISCLIFIPWIWRYHIKPRRAKNQLNEYFTNHPDGARLKHNEVFLKKLYAKLNSYQISKHERKRLGHEEDAFIYGEIEFLSFFSILDKVKPKPGEVFYDLGSGTGKAVYAAALYQQLAKSCGIELLPGLYQAACELSDNAECDAAQRMQMASIQFLNDNFKHCDYSDADILFINATCLSYATWESILEKINLLKSGSRIMVTTKKIHHEQFKILYQGMTLMSWGVNSINIYEKMA